MATICKNCGGMVPDRGPHVCGQWAASHIDRLQRELATARAEAAEARGWRQKLDRELERARAERDAARAEAKQAWDEAVQARVDGAQNIVDATAALEADLAAARADCAQFCGDLERLMKAAGAETVGGALESIAIAKAQLKAANAYAKSDAEKLDAARAEAARLRELLRITCPTCDTVHHAKADRHHWLELCPVMKRIDAALGDG